VVPSRGDICDGERTGDFYYDHAVRAIDMLGATTTAPNSHRTMMFSTFTATPASTRR
jgi:hypothetical protein